MDLAADPEVYTGITSDISENGIFIRTLRVCSLGTIIKIEIYLPEDKISKLKGKVVVQQELRLRLLKNGMGIGDNRKGFKLYNFLNSMDEGNKDNPSDHRKVSSASPPPEIPDNNLLGLQC